MSHFTVLVIQKPETDKNYKSLDDIMAPYSEELEVAPYVENTYDDLVDEGKRLVKSYAEDGRTSEDKGLKALLKKVKAGEPVTDKEYHDFIVEYYDYTVNKKGESMSTYNPNSKWDWYVEGGRWSGELILKSGVRVDSATKKSIDWDKMNSIDPEEEERARRLWKYHVEGEEYPGTDKEKQDEFGFIFYSPEYYKDRYGTVEKYIKSISTWRTWAVVDNDDWYETGKMGWWAMHDASITSEQKWEEEYYDQFIKDLPEDSIITVVDCHI